MANLWVKRAMTFAAVCLFISLCVNSQLYWPSSTSPEILTSRAWPSLDCIPNLSIVVTQNANTDFRNWFGHAGVYIEAPGLFKGQRFVYSLIGSRPSLKPYESLLSVWKSTGATAWVVPLVQENGELPSDLAVVRAVQILSSISYDNSFLILRALENLDLTRRKVFFGGSGPQTTAVCSEFVVLFLREVGLLDQRVFEGCNVRGSRPDLPPIAPVSFLQGKNLFHEFTKPGLYYAEPNRLV